MDTIMMKKAKQKANELGEKATEDDVQALGAKLPSMKKGVIAKVWDKVLFLWEKAKSPEIPLSFKVAIIGALLYLVLPIDAVPDAIPGLGLLDDLGVILSVAHKLSKYVLPKIEKIERKIENKFYEISYQKIDEKLSAVFTSILINTVITFCVNAIGCMILIFKPFGMSASRYVSIALFAVVFIYALIRFILYMKEYGQMTKKLAVSVCKQKNFSKGISDFICTEYKYIAWLFSGIKTINYVMPENCQIPDAPKIVAVFERHYRKRIVLFVVCFILYSALIVATKIILLRM